MEVKQNKELFEEAYTEFQCMIIAQINRFNIEGITATQYNIMDFIVRKGESTTGHLAKSFHISAPAVSRQIKILLEEGYIVQERDKEDRRTCYNQITPKGVKLVKEAVNLRKTMASEIEKIISEEDLVSFTRICKTIVSQIKL